MFEKGDPLNKKKICCSYNSACYMQTPKTYKITTNIKKRKNTNIF